MYVRKNVIIVPVNDEICNAKNRRESKESIIVCLIFFLK
jgi:hypothetical protein